MEREASSAALTARGADDLVSAPSDAELVRCGAELVELSERFYRGVFTGALVFLGLATLAALVVLPLRQPMGSTRFPATGVIAGGLLALATPLAIWRRAALYRLLRRLPRMELVVVAAAAALVVVVFPLRSQLWWPSCALLMVLAVIAPVRRVLVYCLIVLTSNLAAHVLAGDLGNSPAVAIIGLWIGYPFWSATVAVVTGQMAAYLLGLNATAGAHRTPHRVTAGVTERPRDAPDSAGRTRAAPASDESGEAPNEHHVTTAADEPSASGSDSGVPEKLARLTARQLQVVALLADGLRYREIGACLSISERQVQRHVADAAARAGVQSAAELAAVAVAEGMVPSGVARNRA